MPLVFVPSDILVICSEYKFPIAAIDASFDICLVHRLCIRIRGRRVARGALRKRRFNPNLCILLDSVL